MSAGPYSILIIAAIPIWQQFVDLMKIGLTFLAEVTHSSGLAIILFTLLIKFLLTPLTVKSIRSQRAMQDLQPKIKALQKRYGNDRQKVSAETMRLYQEHKVNPMASCFPILLQLPIFWGLYSSIRALADAGVGTFGQGFLWMPTLAKPDSLHILPFVAFFFQLIQTRMSMPTGKQKPSDPQQQMMTQMMQFMPFTVILFGWNFPAGLVLYWATQSVFSAVQQYWITGWGALREWLPFLPEVVRYTPPDDDIEESKVIVTGSDEGRPVSTGGGFWGLINRQMEKVNEQQAAVAETAGEPERARQRIIVRNTTVQDSDPPENRERAKADGADSESRSRVIATDTAGKSAARKSSPARSPGRTEPESAPNGPIVPRKGRSRD